MDRQALRKQANTHKENAVNARNEGRRWDALYEECLYFHLDCQLKGTPEKELPIQAMLTLGSSLMLLRLASEPRKELTAAIVQWSKESGEEDDLKAILERFQS